VTLWAREADVVESIAEARENSRYLPKVRLNELIKATENRHDMDEADLIILMMPAQHTRQTIKDFKDLLSDKPFLIGAKGIEIESGCLLSDVVEQELENPKFGFISGPTFASEVARGLPCAVTLAFSETPLGEEIVQFIGSRTLRTYFSDDMVGVQIGGAVKNVIAIACGVVEGRHMGESARCALVTRGLAEMGRLAKALGARKETLTGMCGIGDLMLTCSSMQSRNFSFGVELGQGKTPSEILEERNSVTEGYYTAKALRTMARNNAVDMPISRAVYDFLVKDAPLENIFEQLLDRPLRHENL
jgi:glycerol-3-phosphate dehydrogenase (NAD(P)+)